jgi:hypothetical protein
MQLQAWPHVVVGSLLLSHLSTVGARASKNCPGCVDYSENLLACENEWQEQWEDYKNVDSQFPGPDSLSCICYGQLDGVTGGSTGLQQMLSCWKCLPANSEANPLLYKWIVTCETYFNDNYGPLKALKCWNSGMKKGCWFG